MGVIRRIASAYRFKYGILGQGNSIGIVDMYNSCDRPQKRESVRSAANRGRRSKNENQSRNIPSLGSMNGVHPDEYVLVEVVVGFAQIWRGVTRGASSMIRHCRRLEWTAVVAHAAIK